MASYVQAGLALVFVLAIPKERHAHEVIGFRGHLERAEQAALLTRFGKLVPYPMLTVVVHDRPPWTLSVSGHHPDSRASPYWRSAAHGCAFA
ncbi:hypothetical protein [Bradyrhizobium sp. SSUT77]|uniref:hypothetical protein n=1 Tax=Bradyrhizobium sp. SSUT77 TaxID=3040603 RepID=UPI00244A2947|nr:hypothetical protein [Bradyrhizobium sp. SSUT77]MDH2349016.1 hypothetical protein [Bradyrhizobium sp. SSUT77]